MTEQQLYPWILWTWIALAPIIYGLLFFVTAPYGRFLRPGWGPRVGAKAGWFFMEAPSWVVLTAMLLMRTRPVSAVAAALYGMWMFHYVYRSILYPALLPKSVRPMPLVIVVFGAFFNLMNAYLNGRYLFAFGPEYSEGWVLDPRFIVGAALFAAGFAIHAWSDQILRKAKAAADGGYVLPEKGFYRLVAAPNYFGEIIEWVGWALAAWSVPGLSFVVWTIANLGPRAASSRKWYRETFPQYPRERKRLAPWIW